MNERRALRLAIALLVASSCSSDPDPVATPSTASAVLAVATTTTLAAAPPTTVAAPPTSAVADLSTAEGLAAELSRAELAIRALPADSDGAAAAGRAQQRAYRALADHPEWDDTVIAAVDPTVAPAVGLNIEARRAVVAHAATRAPSEPPTTLPAWTIAAPLPVETLLGFYRDAEAATGVPWNYLAAVNFVETRFGRILGASPDGAVGPMQFLPSTWAECCVGDPTVPADAIRGAAEYLRSNGAPGDLLAALHAYNPNDGYVGAVDAYARNLAADERAIVGYHAWEVYVGTSLGSVHLPVGFQATEPIDAATYLAAHPADAG